ncbi:MAG TPA: hypothetical protein VMB50_23110 [Myxococcales bacterium]|nr:hypothetical protein [Myxococcales bacterium]
MAWLPLAFVLWLAAPPAPLVIVVPPDAGTAEPSEADARAIDDLELLRRYELLEVYPVLAPP